MTKKAVKLQLLDTVDDASGLRKIQHYTGVEFIRGASDGGASQSPEGHAECYKLIGDQELLGELRFHNLLKIASVKNAQTKVVLNQVNWKQDVKGMAAVLDGSDGADIMQITHDGDKPVGLYAILGGSNSTYERYIVSDEYFEYDGDKAVYYPAFGETPDYATILANQLRSVRSESVIGSTAAGLGTEHNDPDYGTTNGGGFPKTQLSRYQYEAAARAKNANVNSNLPYTIINEIDKELIFGLMAIEFRSKLFNKYLGHGISSNAAPDASTWGKISGVRFSAEGGQTYTYATLGASQLFVNGATAASNWWTIINGYFPLLKMFEAQIAVSEGGTLESVKDADGNAIQGLANGVMTGIWTKTFSFKVSGSRTSGGAAQEFTVDVVLRVPLWRGRNRLWGNLSQWTGGIEAIRYKDGEGKTHHRIYRAPSIEAMTVDSDSAVKSELGQFGFESTYDYLGELPTETAAGVRWAVQMFSKEAIMTAISRTYGGAMLNYEGAANFVNVEATEGAYRRMGARFGVNASSGSAVLRYAVLDSEPSGANTGVGSGFRVRLTA